VAYFSTEFIERSTLLSFLKDTLKEFLIVVFAMGVTVIWYFIYQIYLKVLVDTNLQEFLGRRGKKLTAAQYQKIDQTLGCSFGFLIGILLAVWLLWYFGLLS
jgi:hypothetical protein